MTAAPPSVAIRSLVLTAFTLLALAGTTSAEQKISQDGIEVHYSAFRSTFLDPEIAERYGIPRAENLGVLNITAIKPDPNSILGTPLEADVTGDATNLLSQLKPLEFKEFKLEKGVYYISTFKISNQELLKFDVGVGVKGKQIKLQFRHKFDTQ